jgi:alanine racemase
MGIPDVRHRPVWAEVDLGAIRANVRALIEAVAPARVLAVVKADAYGHGSVPVARAAVAAGATGLGVALVEEGQTLRRAGIAAPILLLSEPPADAAEAVAGV